MKLRMKPIAVAAALFGVPMAAWADPITITAALAPYVGGTVAAAVASAGAFIAANSAAISLGLTVFNAYRQRRMAKKENARRIREYNASLSDRTVTALREEAPERYVYGECEVGGDVVAIFTSDIVAADGQTKPDGYKHLVVVCAAHRVKSIKDIKIDGVSLQLYEGAATAPEFSRENTGSKTETATGGTASLTVSQPVAVIPSNIITCKKGERNVVVPQGGTYGYSRSGQVVTFPAQVQTSTGVYETVDSSWTWSVTYVAKVPYTNPAGFSTVGSTVYASTFNGSHTQGANAYLKARVPGQWLDSDRLQGRAGAVITLDLQESRFQGGIPRITFVVEGRDEIYDPRLNEVADPEFWNGGFDALVSSNGISVTQIGQTVEQGRRCVDLRVHGTALTGGAYPYVYWGSVSASTGQIWWAGVEMRTLTGVDSGLPNVQAVALNSGGSIIQSMSTGFVPEELTFGSTVKSRRSVSAAFSTVGTSRAAGRTLWSFAPGTTVDFTVRMSLPTLSQGADAVGYTTNAALCVDDWLRSARWGFGVIPNAVETETAANACDVSTTFTEYVFPATGVGPPSPVTSTGPRYTVNGAFTADDDKESVLTQLAAAMGGRVIDGAEYLVQAGSWTPPVMDLINGDEAGPIQIVQTGEGLDTLVNSVRARYVPSGDGSAADMRPPYANSTFVAADGEELWDDVAYPFTNSSARARNLSRLRVEESRNGLVISFPAKVRAWNLRPGQRVRVSNTERGWTLKHFRITDWQFAHRGVVVLTLREDDESSWDDADAATADPTPNSGLPNPFLLEPVAGLAASSGTAQLLRLQDGTIVPRVRVSWTPSTSSFMGGNGRVDVDWQDPAVGQWHTFSAAGLDASLFLEGVKEGTVILIRATAVNSIGTRSPSSYLQHLVLGKSEAPANVSNFDSVPLVGGAQFSWDANTEADYRDTELRIGTDWASGVTIWVGSADTFGWSQPSGGTYTAWAKHNDTSGNSSAAAVSTVVTVGTSSDALLLDVSASAFVVPADSAGAVISYAGASCSIRVLASGTDDTANWTLSKTDSTGVTSNLVGTTLSLTSLLSSTEAGYIDVSASRSGFITLSRRVQVAKVRQGNAGTPGTPGSNGSNGVDGANGVRTARPEVFQWAASTPAVPGSSPFSYTWSTGAVSATPAGWSLTAGSSPVPGYRLYAASVYISDNSTAATSSANWNTATISVRGSDGFNGTRGTVTTVRLIAGSAWSDSEANAAISAATGGAPINSDVVTLYNGSSYSETRFFSVSAWIVRTAYINGNLLVDGTVQSSKIVTTSLSALSANLGSVTSGSLTGAYIQTALSGQRVMLNESGSNTLRVYANGGAGEEMIAHIGPAIYDSDLSIARFGTISSGNSSTGVSGYSYSGFASRFTSVTSVAVFAQNSASSNGPAIRANCGGSGPASCAVYADGASGIGLVAVGGSGNLGKAAYLYGTSSLVYGSASHDPYGVASVTVRDDSGGKAYYGLTRYAQQPFGIGIDAANRFIVGVPSAGSFTISSPGMALSSGGAVQFAGGFGCNGVSPPSRPTLPAAGADALVNAIRSALINCGIAQ